MSVVLSVYSQSAYKEFVLPAIHNAETVLTIDRKIFRLQEDLELHLEVVDQKWFALPSDSCKMEGKKGAEENPWFEDQDNFILKSAGGEVLSIIVQMKDTSFVSYSKYDLSDCQPITIGSDPESIIYYSYQYAGHQYISQRHASIYRNAQGGVLEDRSKNGVFVNDIRVQGSRQLDFGDHIHLWGLDLVYLKDVLAVRQSANTVLNQEFLKPWKGTGIQVPCAKPPVSGGIYHRAPRSVEKLETEQVEIEAPPTLREPGEVPLMMAVGPAMTMAVPMVMSSVLAIIGARTTGTHASTFMYTGMITALCSAAIGIFWAVSNIRYGRVKARKEELHRFEAYSEYLIKCTDDIKGKYEHNMRVLRQMYPSAEACVSGGLETAKALWERNSTHQDFLTHRLGIGDMPFQVEIQIPKERFTLINDSLADRPGFIQENYKTLHQVPVCLNLLKEKIVGVIGAEDRTGAYSVIYALTAQIAAQNSYTDVKLAFVFQEEQGRGAGAWEFARWLPHVWAQDKKVRFTASNKAEARDVFYELTKVLRFRSEERKNQTGEDAVYKPHYILVLEEPSLLEGEPIAKYIFDKEKSLGLTTVLMAGRYEDLPNACECIIQNDREFHGIYNIRSGERSEVSFDYLNQNMLELMARRLTNIRVSEVEVGGDIPDSITFFDMYGVSGLEELNVEERWKKNRTYESMKALIGQKAGGIPCYLDVHEKYHGPHGLVAGTTGSGKSETLQTYMLSLAINFSPDDIGFFIIDYKGGGMANLFNGLPHILGQISNLSGNQVRRAMVSIKSENKRRQRVFNEHGVNNINAYTALYKNGEAVMPVPHLFIIIDEFAELKREESDFMKELISVAQVGRSLGVHLILATQKPSGTVDDNIWSNSKFRLCLRVQDRQDSADMLHKPDAAYLTQAGRCYLQVGNDELYELFQSGWSGAAYDEEAGGSRQAVAKMLTSTGKAALVGSHVKRKQKEMMRLRWLMRLVGYIEEAESSWESEENVQIDSEISREQFLTSCMFEALKKDGFDFVKNDYNEKTLYHLLQLYSEARGQGEEKQENICIYVMKQALAREMKLPELKDKTQLDAVVKYLAATAKREGYRKPQQLWLPVLPEELYLEQLEGYKEQLFDGEKWPQYGERWSIRTMVGLCDDPMRQAQLPLTLNFTEDGHHAVCGIAMSGRSTFLQTVVYDLIHRYSPAYLNLYLLDFSSRMLGAFEGEAHVGGILYENDLGTIGKFFHMLDDMVKERKQLFKGGNYSQYVMIHGAVCPVVLVIIDNMAGFREKTEFQYDDNLLQLSRECASYGIYLLVSGGGYNSAEIPVRLGENLHRTICMEMIDRFQYSDCLNSTQLPVLPEPGIHGRGLAMVGGDALEFQTALSAAASDDYKRNEEIQKECARLNGCWNGSCARPIPMIPEKPVWSEFALLGKTRELAADDRSLPIGYNMETADIYPVDLSRSCCYTISGKARTGKTNLLKVLMRSAEIKGGKLVVVEMGNQELKKPAKGAGAEYIDSYEGYMEFMSRFVPAFQKRNRIKKECLAQGMEEEEVYTRQREEESYFIFIADLTAFTMMAHGSQGVKDNLCGGMANLFEKGFLHNIYFFACFNQDQRNDIAGKDVFEKFIRAKAGIHLGGNVSSQRLFEFNGMPFGEQTSAGKPGIGAVPPTDNESYIKVVIPLAKG